LQNINKKILLYLLTDFVVLVFCIFGIYHIYMKVDLPVKFHSENSNLIVKKIKQPALNISVGDTVISINGNRFTSPEQVEVYLDGTKPGSSVNIVYLKKGSNQEINVKLISFYHISYLITAFLVGIIFLVIGIFVFLKKTEKKSSQLFHWVAVSTAAIIMMTWGNYNIHPKIIGYIVWILFTFSQLLAPVLFVHFTFIFPREKKVHKSFYWLLYSLASILGLAGTYTFTKVWLNNSLDNIQIFLAVYDICRAFLVGSVLIGIINFIHSYKTSRSLADKKKLRWIMSGLFVGPFCYAVLWVIPQAIVYYGLLPEEIIVIFMLSIPVSFAIAILKYHILDIDLIIRRSVVYLIAITLLGILYALVILIISFSIKNVSEYFSTTVAALILLFLFQPAKLRIQRFVDKKFFRVHYNFRIASRKFLDEIKDCNNIKTLADKITNQINLLIAVKKQGFFLFSESNSRVYLEADYNFEILRGRGIFLDQGKLKTNLPQPVALINKVEPGSRIEEADEKVFKRWAISLVFPIKSSTELFLGFLVLGEKKSERRFTIEDIDLLIEVNLQAGLTIERIKIQEALIKEKLLKEKLQELNELKTFFISSVSHELKTPLTSIRMFAEMLHLKENLKTEKAGEYLEIIEGECDRLSRLIENVLDLSKIERGIKEYHFTEIDLKSLLNHAVHLMSYQLKIEKCDINLNICDGEYIIKGDSDSILGAVINLLSNGIKYSSVPKKIIISLEKNNNGINMNFENRSSCLSEDELKRLMEPYFRADNSKNRNISGSGIGLTLVNQIMSAHKGKFIVKNIPDIGCRFILSFPLEIIIEKDLSH
jgi:signal transduction histidine kinase